MSKQYTPEDFITIGIPHEISKELCNKLLPDKLTLGNILLELFKEECEGSEDALDRFFFHSDDCEALFAGLSSEEISLLSRAVFKSSGITLLHIAASYDCKNFCEALVKAGADLEQKEMLYGETPLFYAARCDLEITQKLLELGADPLIVNDLGVLPSEEAGNQEIRSALLKAEENWKENHGG